MTKQSDVQDVLDRLKSAQQKPLGDPRFKGIAGLEKSGTFTESSSPASGLTFYDLELGAKFLYPVLTPLRNMIPRVSGKGGIQPAWRAITQINATGLRFGVSAADEHGAVSLFAPLPVAEPSFEDDSSYSIQGTCGNRGVVGQPIRRALSPTG